MANVVQEPITVDLKLSLWSTWSEQWECDLLKKMQLAFEGVIEPITIIARPNNVIRVGEVKISEGKAEINFFALWDDPSSLIPEDFPQDDVLRALLEGKIKEYIIGHHSGFMDGEDTIGAEIDRIVLTDKFDVLMEGVDNAENDLIIQEQSNSDDFDTWIAGEIKELLSSR